MYIVDHVCRILNLDFRKPQRNCAPNSLGFFFLFYQRCMLRDAVCSSWALVKAAAFARALLSSPVYPGRPRLPRILNRCVCIPRDSRSLALHHFDALAAHEAVSESFALPGEWIMTVALVFKKKKEKPEACTSPSPLDWRKRKPQPLFSLQQQTAIWYSENKKTSALEVTFEMWPLGIRATCESPGRLWAVLLFFFLLNESTCGEKWRKLLVSTKSV